MIDPLPTSATAAEVRAKVNETVKLLNRIVRRMPVPDPTICSKCGHEHGTGGTNCGVDGCTCEG